MDSYQHSSPVPSPRIHVHNEDTVFVMDQRHRRSLTPKVLFKAALGGLLLLAAFMAVNSSSGADRTVALDTTLLGGAKDDYYREYFQANLGSAEETNEEAGGMPKPKEFDWKKIESKGEYNWQKCKESADPDCWKQEGDRVHTYWHDFGMNMKTYWTAFGERMHHFWATAFAFGGKKTADDAPAAAPVLDTPSANATEPVAP